MQPDFAFYYPGQHWRDVDWIKNLVCFFDGIAILMPYDIPNPLRRDDDPVAWALEDHKLIRVIRPEDIIDEKATEALAEAFGKIISSGRLNHLTKRDGENIRKADFEALAKAKLGVHIVAAFHNDYESIADFEAKHGVKVPEDIAALLIRD